MMNPQLDRFFEAVVDLCGDLYRLGWAENHAGNLSYRLSDDERRLFGEGDQRRTVTLDEPLPALAGESFLVTSAGSPFRLLVKEPRRHTGVIDMASDGGSYDIVWGLIGDRRPTSELPAHLRGHAERGVVDPENRVVLHCHPTHLVAMTHVHPLDEVAFTRALWATNSESILAIPEGIGLLPWMVCGTDTIGIESARKFREVSVVVWPYHGVLVGGRSLQAAMGMVESVDKAAETWLLSRGPEQHAIEEDQLRELAEEFDIHPPARFLSRS
ncbi:rhamnulose-1-phosphate aldolase [Aeromicrobium sp. YIM 150415]|uniref:rhamnulose-1-phosphate aldolase n=1 Tax=Aeromicrobium sp. YIM 150415 TaxID=2803912 RepID=UPI001963D642|nr:rhamnulose-1-phosphate aldolase [Aeromicrobium sp. YIM 150415]MBM9464664.1 rhamnulose-1-phosphate aldolase [Aeromicrobium sp. YIM 150415]